MTVEVAGFACPACGVEAAPTREHASTSLAIVRCRGCGHRVGLVPQPSRGRAPDYHAQVQHLVDTAALEVTRRRQARRIIGVLRPHLAAGTGILDIGAGHGWFLDECRIAGLAKLGALDSSALAVEELVASGIPARQCDLDGDWPELPFAPSIVCLLDVVEHLPPARLATVLARLLDRLAGSVRVVVVKVPSAEGLLYRMALALARAGFLNPLLQLYQVGTSPHHHSYFTRRSLSALARRVRLRELQHFGDSDIDAEALRDRVASLRWMPRAPIRWLGHALRRAADCAQWHDAAILVAATGLGHPLQADP